MEQFSGLFSIPFFYNVFGLIGGDDYKYRGVHQ